MLNSPRILTALVFVISFATALPATAQRIPGVSSRQKSSQAAPPMPKTAEGKGTVEAVSGDLLKIKLRGKTWLVKPGPECKIEVLGTADIDYLRPGLLVRFNAEVNKKGIVAEPIDDIEVVTLRQGESMGTFSNSIDAAPGTRAVPKGEEPMSLQVVGRITKLKDGKALVVTGRMNVQAEVKPDAKVRLNTTDYSLAAEGDLIEVKGSYLESGALFAEKMEITLAKPVSNEKKPQARTSKKEGVAPAGEMPPDSRDGKKA